MHVQIAEIYNVEWASAKRSKQRCANGNLADGKAARKKYYGDENS